MRKLSPIHIENKNSFKYWNNIETIWFNCEDN